MDKVFEKNINGSDYIIGDLHGCYSLFTSMLERIDFDKEKDRMFSVGDLIDRGENSIDCLYLIKEPWFHAVTGNHEDLLIDTVIRGADSGLWNMNGGLWHHAINAEELKSLADHVLELPLSITIKHEDGDIGICHAQPPSLDWNDVKSPSERDEKVMLWARSWIADKQMEDIDNVAATFHGHTPVDNVVQIGNVHFIDTGAVFTGNLTCIKLFDSNEESA
jgi:serine/threonine protein phosphatase 1